MKHIDVFYNFFSIYKIDKVIIRNTKKDFRKKCVKGINIFLRKEKTKGEKKVWERYQNLTEEEKVDKHSNNLFEEQMQK